MAAMPPPPPPPPPGNHGAGPSHYNDENAGLNLNHGPGERDIENVFNNLTHHVNLGRAEVARHIAAVRMERENELFDQNIRRHVQADRQRRAEEQQRRAAAFQSNNTIPPYQSPPLDDLYPGLDTFLAVLGVPLRTQANTRFNTNGVNPR
jgi:hypothetical protein